MKIYEDLFTSFDIIYHQMFHGFPERCLEVALALQELWSDEALDLWGLASEFIGTWYEVGGSKSSK
jgi:hypothetical protein